MIRWKLKEQYDVQNTKYMEMIKARDAKVREAEQKVADLVAKKTELLRREVAEGKDLSAERAATSAEIENAEKEVLEAKELRSAASAYVSEASQKGRISILDLTQDWNHKFIPEVREKEFAPILQRMSQAREEILNALLDFYELEDAYGDQRREIQELETRDANQRGRVSYAIHQIELDYNLPIKDIAYELNKIKKYRELPKGIDRKPTQSK